MGCGCSNNRGGPFPAESAEHDQMPHKRKRIYKKEKDESKSLAWQNKNMIDGKTFVISLSVDIENFGITPKQFVLEKKEDINEFYIFKDIIGEGKI